MRPSPELEGIVRRIMRARRDGELERVINLYSQSEHFRAIGTARDEWVGTDVFLSSIRDDWESRDVHEDDILRIEAFENGDTGWVALEAERETASGHTWTYRLTVVFVLEQGVWRAIQSHFSAPVDDAVLDGAELTPTLSDLMDSIDSPVGGPHTRTATVAFTDIVGSTSLSESMGDAEWSATVSNHLDELRAVVARSDGTVVKTLGDGGMFVFDAASAALRAADAIRAATVDAALPIRMGVHTGDLVAGDGDVLGATVAKAARLTAAADGGQVLVSAPTVGMANPTEFAFGPPIVLELRGLAGIHVAHELR